MRDPTHCYVRHNPLLRVTWPISIRDMTHLCDGSSRCRLARTFDTIRCVWHTSLLRVTWLTTCDMTLLSFVWVWPICMRDMTHRCVWSWWRGAQTLGRMCDLTHFLCVTWLMATSDMTHGFDKSRYRELRTRGTKKCVWLNTTHSTHYPAFFTYKCTHTHTYTCICVYVYIYICICISTYVYIYICICVCAYIYMYAYIYIYMYIYMYIYIFMGVCINIYIHIHTYIYIYI